MLINFRNVSKRRPKFSYKLLQIFQKKKKLKIQGFDAVYVRVENLFGSVLSVKEHSLGQVQLSLASLDSLGSVCNVQSP